MQQNVPTDFDNTWIHLVDNGRLNQFLNTPFWDCPKSKEVANDNWNVAIKGF